LTDTFHEAGEGITTAPTGWPAVEQLSGVRGEPSRCWCRFFALPGASFAATPPADRKTQLKDKFDGDGGSDRSGTGQCFWLVSCFVVAPGHRRSGVAAALLGAAVEHARANGATLVRGIRWTRPKGRRQDRPTSTRAPSVCSSPPGSRWSVTLSPGAQWCGFWWDERHLQVR
jgi:GNAT superfamily N-acetyltransferase